MKSQTLPPIYETTIEKDGHEFPWEIEWRNQKLRFPIGMDPSSTANKDIVRELWTMVDKCMQYNPNERFQLFKSLFLDKLMLRPAFTEIFDVLDKIQQTLTDRDSMTGVYESANTLDD